MNPVYRPLSTLQRAVLIGVGTTTLGLGIAGIFLPGVPTTVFLLITLGCYTRSSERMYRWVLTRPWLQKPLQTALAFKEKGALPVRIKLIAQAVAWSSVILTVFSGARMWAQILTIIFATSCSIAMAIIKTEGDNAPSRVWRNTPGDIARQLLYGALAGALAGLIWGIGGCVIMRFVANIADKSPQFNLQLTPIMLVATAILGSLIGLVYAGLRRILPKGKWVNGFTFGVLAMLTLGAVLYVTPYMQADIVSVGLEWRELIVALFVPNFIVFGIVTSLAFRSLERRLD
jgi:uncharacterized membrane protein YbaN (DUF454 family)